MFNTTYIYFFCNIIKTEGEIVKKTNEGFFKRAWDFVDSDEGAAALIYYFHREVKIPAPPTPLAVLSMNARRLKSKPYFLICKIPLLLSRILILLDIDGFWKGLV